MQRAVAFIAEKESEAGGYWRVWFMSAWPRDPNDLLTRLVLFLILRVIASCLEPVHGDRHGFRVLLSGGAAAGAGVTPTARFWLPLTD